MKRYLSIVNASFKWVALAVLAFSTWTLHRDLRQIQQSVDDAAASSIPTYDLDKVHEDLQQLHEDLEGIYNDMPDR